MPESQPLFAGFAHLLSEVKLQHPLLTNPTLNISQVFPGHQMESIKGPYEYEDWGGSLSNTLFWLTQFEHQVNIIGTVGNDQVGQNFVCSANPNVYHLSIKPGISGRFAYANNPTTGEPAEIYYNYGVTTTVMPDRTIEPDTCLIGGFELQTTDDVGDLIYLANRYVITLGGITDTDKLIQVIARLADKKIVVVGNQSEVVAFNQYLNPQVIVVTTKAAEGAEIEINNDVIASTKPQTNRPVVDVMGAGDAFLAKFLSDWFISNFSEDESILIDALQNAVNFATLVSTYPGARPSAVIDSIRQHSN